VDSRGWGTYSYALLRDGSGNPVTLSLNGSTNTFRLTSTGPEANTEVNANFLMLVPLTTPTPGSISASLDGGNIVLSFPTDPGFSYQVQFKDNVTDSSWSNLGNAISGDGTVKSINDAATGSHRFYRVAVQ
jgi:hypothetical protein